VPGWLRALQSLVGLSKKLKQVHDFLDQVEFIYEPSRHGRSGKAKQVDAHIRDDDPAEPNLLRVDIHEFTPNLWLLHGICCDGSTVYGW